MMVAILGNRDFTVEGSIPVTMQPLKRVGKDEEIAGTVPYLHQRQAHTVRDQSM